MRRTASTRWPAREWRALRLLQHCIWLGLIALQLLFLCRVGLGAAAAASATARGVDRPVWPKASVTHSQRTMQAKLSWCSVSPLTPPGPSCRIWALGTFACLLRQSPTQVGTLWGGPLGVDASCGWHGRAACICQSEARTCVPGVDLGQADNMRQLWHWARPRSANPPPLAVLPCSRNWPRHRLPRHAGEGL